MMAGRMLHLPALLILGSTLLCQASRTLPARSVCTPTAGGSASVDDTPAIQDAIKSCGSGGTIVIPSGTTYYLNSVLDFSGCSGCDFQIEGLCKFSGSTDYWEGKTAQISISDISGVKIRSLTGSGVIDGNGQAAYDVFAANSSYARPTMLYITGGSDIEISGLRMKNAPNVFNSVKGGTQNLVYSDLELDATSSSDNPAKNTDGFDIGESTYVTATNIKVTNDDDCIAFKSGSNYVTVRNVTCIGSHGISVGSLGKTNADTVQNVYASDIVMINSTKAAGIKSYQGGSGEGSSTVSNVTFTGFTVQNCDYAIQIQSCYGADTDTCDGTANLTDIVFSGFTGTTSSTYAPTTSNIDCAESGTCGITISNYTVKAPSGSGQVLCANTPEDLGVTCTSGASG